MPDSFRTEAVLSDVVCEGSEYASGLEFSELHSSCVQVSIPILVSMRRRNAVVIISHSSLDGLSGGYCSGVPPLPIPNREVKPACADGTAMQCGRVGGRHLSRSPVITTIAGLLWFARHGHNLTGGSLGCGLIAASAQLKTRCQW